MQEQPPEIGGFRFGDKVRIRSGPYTRARGIIKSEMDGILEIQLDTGIIIRLPPEEFTNYSLAARRAWKAMPKRSGRPHQEKPVKRMVSMRIDIDVWDMLQEAIRRDLISNREKAVNDWLRESVIKLLSQEK